MNGEYEMTKYGFVKIKFFEKSGARLYIPENIKSDSSFPFENGDIIKIMIGNDSLKLEKPEWWEMLDWKNLEDVYNKVPEDVREKIRQAGLAPI